jgi:tetratricopeptide (TPR) repeat protein
MSSPDEPVEPTPFEPAQTPSGANNADEESSGKWLLPSLLTLVVLALVVFFWLPHYVDTRESNKLDSPATPSSNTGQKPSASDQASPNPQRQESEEPAADNSPWADAQQAKLRLEAQNILAELLDLQFALEESNVKLWGQEALARAAKQAGKGDETYRARDYKKSIEHYRESLATLQALEKDKTIILEENLATAEEKIQQGDPGGAQESVDTASAIDAAHPGLANLRERIRTLPEILSLLTQAKQSEEAGDLETASALLAKAAAIDPLHQATADNLQRINTSLTNQQFQRAMSNGYLALGEGKLKEALREFEKARSLDASSKVAADAIIEVENARTTSTLAAQQKKGVEYEGSEQWTRAVKTYTQALDIDPSLTYAVEGLKRSTVREKLDLQFKKIMADPDRLSDLKIAQEATDFLQQMRATTPQGKVLLSQINDLDKLLLRARTPVALKLLSDEETEVVIYKVGRLGKFQQRELELRPGTYIALGTRNGFRDVRKEIPLRPENSANTVTIVCTEAI